MAGPFQGPARSFRWGFLRDEDHWEGGGGEEHRQLAEVGDAANLGLLGHELAQVRPVGGAEPLVAADEGEHSARAQELVGAGVEVWIEVCGATVEVCVDLL
jgi:hypothetical protein